MSTIATMDLVPGTTMRLDNDLEVARDLAGAVRAIVDVGDVLGPSLLSRVIKEVLWFRWEQQRLPRPLVDGKYPRSYPWSRAARQVYLDSPRRPGRAGMLVIEHVVPKRELLRRVIEQDFTDDTQGFVDVLQEGCAAVVITRDEDRQITTAGYGHVRPEGDVWARYRASGIDLDGFAPLTSGQSI